MLNEEFVTLFYDFVKNNPIIFATIATTFITSLSNTLISNIINLASLIFIWLYSFVVTLFYTISFKIKRKFKLNYNSVVINSIKITSGTTWEPKFPDGMVCDKAMPILWYMNKNCDMTVQQIFDIDPQNSSWSNRKKDNMYVPLQIQTSFMNKIIPQTQQYNTKKSDFYENMHQTEKENILNSTVNYLQLSNNSIKITDNICLDIEQDITYIKFILKSKKPVKFIKEFIEKIEKDYKDFLINNNEFRNKVFVYIGLNKGKPEYCEYEIDKSQTFENIFTNNKNRLEQLLQQFGKLDFYKERGIKRKISAIFYGESGTGKTATCVAIANKLDRCIILVPIGRIKTNLEVEKILYSNEVNQYIISNENKIFLFDELDSAKNIKDWKKITTVPEKPEEKGDTFVIVEAKDNKPDATSELDDPFNIGHFATIIDGPMNQENMIILATANNLSIFDESLCRDGRFTKIEFLRMGRHEIADMINKYFISALTLSEIEEIRDDKKLTNQTIKQICLECLQNNLTVYETINKINN